MTLSPEGLPDYLAANPRLVEDQNSTEAHLFSLMVTGAFAYNMWEPAWYLLSIPTSAIYKVAILSGGPWFIATLFTLTGLCMLPKLLVDLCAPKYRECRMPRLLAVGSAIIASFTWWLLAWMARPLDVGAGQLHFIYGANAIGYMLLAGVYGKSLNVQQINEASTSR